MSNHTKTIVFSSIVAIITFASIISFGFYFSDNYGDTNGASNSVLPEVFSQEFTSLSKNNPTIKVTGDASRTLEPDRAVIVIAKHSQPTDIMNAMAEQKYGTQELIDAVKNAVGGVDDNNSIEIIKGHFGLDPFYMGEESYSNINTFTVRSTTSVETDIDHFSDVVNKLTEEGYTFESVYASHLFRGPIGFAASSGSLTGLDQAEGGITIEEEDLEIQSEQNEENNDEADKITLNIAVSTKPASISEAVESYEQKHQKLLEILTEEIGIPHDKIQPANVDINPLHYGPPVNQNSIYNTYSQIFVKTNPENIENITAAAQEHSAYIENIIMTISEEALNEARDQLNQEAFLNAKSGAQKLAEKAGLDIGGVQSIESITEPMEQNRIFSGGLYPVDPWRYYDSSEVGVSVTVEFELKR